MAPRIMTSPLRTLVGKRLTTALVQNSTFELWNGFMRQQKEISNRINGAFLSVEIYDPASEFEKFTKHTKFEKWAAVEVSNHLSIPVGMEPLVIKEGLYAVFIHRGPARDGARLFDFIFKEWIPASEYTVDQRPHFEIMTEKYRHEDPDSEEELWVPITRKTSPPQG
ncbi:MAG: GyrI-like domain-containing protein [bacterium]|nr:GyrI-like domain-containing protein [bacterium]